MSDARMEQLSLVDFDDLCSLVLNGEKSIQEHFDVYNNRRDVLTKMSFLNYLLKYKNIHKDNLLKTLHHIYLLFQKRIHNLSTNEIIQKMIDRNNQEWYVDGMGISIKDPVYDDFFDQHLECQESYDGSCKLYDEIEKLVNDEHNIPLESKLHSSHPLEKHFDSGILSCEESIKHIEGIINEINSQLISYFKNFDLSQIIDLSIKHKSLYLTLIDQEDLSSEIPENIHKIFSNYIYIHNLFYKQIIQYYNYLQGILTDLKKKCEGIKDVNQNAVKVAFIDSQKQAIDDEMKNVFYTGSDIDEDEDSSDNDDDDDDFSEQFEFDLENNQIKKIDQKGGEEKTILDQLLDLL